MTTTVFRALGVVLLVFAPPLRAEVSVDRVAGRVNTLVMGGITEDPNPIGHIWLQYRPLDPDLVLNASGDARGDGRPDIGGYSNGWPLAVWAFNSGPDFDIALSEWDGDRWSPSTFLTAGGDDERDPRLFVDADGTIHVVWWTIGPSEEIWLITRPGGSPTWEMPVLVTTGVETGRRPAVAVFESALYIAFEQDSSIPGMSQDVRLATLQPAGGFTFETIRATARSAALDAMLHAEHGSLWVDWKHETVEFGCAKGQPDGSWGGVVQEPWLNPSWVGVEEARKAIRERILE